MAAGGNSANAKLCQKGGWTAMYRADGTTFANQGACVSYGTQGGRSGTPPPATTGTGAFTGALDTSDAHQTWANVPGPFCGGEFDAHYDTYQVTLSAASTLTITMQGQSSNNGSLYDPILELYSGSYDPAHVCTNLIATNDDGLGIGPDSQITQSVPAGTYVVVATTFWPWDFLGGGATGTYKLTITAS